MNNTNNLKPHSNFWYDQLGIIKKKYEYPWNSVLPINNGEDNFIEYLYSVIEPEHIVLDVGCGHGELAIDISSKCKSIYGYDRVPEFIETANELKEKKKITNLFFIHGNSKIKNGDSFKVRVPIEKQIFDIIYSRRGPTNFIEDLKRISKIGTRIIQLNPVPRPIPEWINELPGNIQKFDFRNNEFDIKKQIQRKLNYIGQEIDRCWFFDVPEYFNDIEELYKYLFWYDLNEPKHKFKEVKEKLLTVFNKFGVNNKITLRHRRFLWTAVIK